MTDIEPKRLPTPQDFFACPLWRYDEEDDLYHPVVHEKDIPDSERDLSTRAIFITPSGKSVDGYVVGISRVFSIGLFGEGCFFHANQNLQSESQIWMQKFVDARPDLGIESWSELFPLRYHTQIERLGYTDFSGVFDLKC